MTFSLFSLNALALLSIALMCVPSFAQTQPATAPQSPTTQFVAPPRTDKIRIVLAGDSTVTDQSGWGAGFKKLLSDKAECFNTSVGGRSSKSFSDEGLWAKTMTYKADYVLIQFGHNDEPGKGPDKETDPATTYRANMTRYVEDVRKAGGTPILVTSLSRRYFKDNKIKSSLGKYAAVVREIAAEKKVPLIDLHARSIELYEKIGQDAALKLGPAHGDGTYDRTHLSAEGSDVIAALVVEDLKKAVPSIAPCFK